jgi:hypothetical protein
MVSSLFCLCFILLFRPYKTALNNVVEMLNESFVIATVYIMHGFSFFIPSHSTRYKIGWFYIGIVGIVFILNLAVIIQKIVLFAMEKIRRFKAQKRLMNKKNALSRLFSWKPKLAETLRRKRRMAENIVAPMHVLESEDFERKY